MKRNHAVNGPVSAMGYLSTMLALGCFISCSAVHRPPATPTPRPAADLARAVSADVPGLNVEMRYTAIPSELATEPGANMLFDEAWMLRLEKLGYERARSTSPWDEIGSPYERPAPVRSRSSQQ
jgi:hypothetical protein